MTNTPTHNQPPEQRYSLHPILAEANIGDILTLTPAETDEINPISFRVTRLASDGCWGEVVGVENGEIVWSSSLGALVYTDKEELVFAELRGWGFTTAYDTCESVEITDVLKTKNPIPQQEPLKCLTVFEGWQYSDGNYWDYLFIEGDPVFVKLENGDSVEGVYSYSDGDKLELRDNSGNQAGTLLSTKGYIHCRTCASYKNYINKNSYTEHRKTCNGTAWDAVIEYRDAEGRFVDRVADFNGSPSVLWKNTWNRRNIRH